MWEYCQLLSSLIEIQNTNVSRLHNIHLPWKADIWNTSHYEAGRDTANLDSYYVFDIKLPAHLMWFYCKTTFHWTDIDLAACTSTTEMFVSLQNDTSSSILTTNKKIIYSDFLDAEQARSMNTSVWSLLYDINRECS